MGQRAANHRGQAIIELVLLVSLLMLIALGAIQFGILYGVHLKVEHAAREGARYAAIHARDGIDPQIVQHTIDAAPDLKPPLAGADVAISPANEADRRADQPITISVEYDYDPDVPVVGALLPTTMTFRARTTMRMEG